MYQVKGVGEKLDVKYYCEGPGNVVYSSIARWGAMTLSIGPPIGNSSPLRKAITTQIAYTPVHGGLFKCIPKG
jgi:hypothetical protein